MFTPLFLFNLPLVIEPEVEFFFFFFFSRLCIVRNFCKASAEEKKMKSLYGRQQKRWDGKKVFYGDTKTTAAHWEFEIKKQTVFNVKAIK